MKSFVSRVIHLDDRPLFLDFNLLLILLLLFLVIAMLGCNRERLNRAKQTKTKRSR